MISQSMTREYGSHGIHVAHVVIDGGINGDRLRNRAPTLVNERGEDELLGIDAIADTYWNIHRQQRSAWTQEVDLRPFKETFWGWTYPREGNMLRLNTPSAIALVLVANLAMAHTPSQPPHQLFNEGDTW